MFDKDLDHLGDDTIPHVTFRLVDTIYGVSAASVRTMLEIPAVTPVPRAPDFVRGLIKLRGQALPLIDLRLRLGMTSTLADLEGFSNMLAAREQDHRNWLAELEASVREERPFKLTTDPHACAFGKWYDNFATDNATMRNIVRRFDRPHRKIHAVAHAVAEAVTAGDFARSAEIIETTRNKELARMIELFAAARKAYREEVRETVLVLEAGRYAYGVTVDAVEAVEIFDDDALMPNPVASPVGTMPDPVIAMGRRPESDVVVQLLDPALLCRLRDLAPVSP